MLIRGVALGAQNGPYRKMTPVANCGTTGKTAFSDSQINVFIYLCVKILKDLDRKIYLSQFKISDIVKQQTH